MFDRFFVNDMRQNISVISHELEPWMEQKHLLPMRELEDYLLIRAEILGDALIERIHNWTSLDYLLEDCDDIYRLDLPLGYVVASNAVSDALSELADHADIYAELTMTECIDALNNDLEEQLADDLYEFEPPEHFLHSLRGKEISDVIVSLNAYWMDKWFVSPWKINCGDCEQYADCLCVVFPEAESFWGNELLTEEEYADDAISDQYAWHCITKYQGRYYDAEHPFGVDDFRDISAFHSNERPT